MGSNKTTFTDLGLDTPLVRPLDEMGYLKPTNVQAKASLWP